MGQGGLDSLTGPDLMESNHVHDFDITIQPQNKRARLKNRIVYALAACAVTLTFWQGILSVFPLVIDHALVYVGQTVAVLLWVAVCGMRRGRKTAVLTVLIICTGAAFSMRQILEGGMNHVANQYILLRNQFNGTTQPIFQITQEGWGLVPTLFLVQMLLAAVLIAVLYAGKYAAAPPALMAVPFVSAATVGHMPSVLSGWGSIAAAILYFIIYRSQDMQSLKKELPAAAAIFAVVALGAAAVQPAVLGIRKSNYKEYVGIHNVLVDAQQIDFRSMLTKTFEGNANYVVGGVGQGDLRNLAENRPKGTKDLEIILDGMPRERVYLKAYVGSEYTGKKWKEPSAGEFRKMLRRAGQSGKGAEVFGEPFERIKNGQNEKSTQEMELTLEGADSEFAYSPYFAEVTEEDSVYADAYIQGKGKDRQEYTFYPRESVESLNGTFIADESKAWEAYGDYVKNNYTDFPDGLDTLKTYCGGMDADSVNEAAENIDRRFEESLSYSLSPGEFPPDRDFAEYFLTEKQEGFCVHFATAATLIYRAQGFASRYVEGYAVPAEAFKKQEDGTWKAVVTDAMAHAWSETFDADIGWRVREHTPAASFDDVWTMAAQAEGEEAPPRQEEGEDIRDSGETDQGQPTVEPQESEAEVQEEKKQDVAEDAESDGDGTGIGKSLAGRIRKYAAVLLGIAVLLLLIGILQQKIRMQNKRHRFRLTRQNHGITNIYNDIYEIAVFAGFQEKGRKEQETLGQMQAMFSQLTREEWEWLYDCAQRAAFAEGQTDKDELQKMYGLYSKFRKNILNGLKGRKRFLFLYLRGL